MANNEVCARRPTEDRTCPVTGCDQPIKWDVFMCRRHWYQVPRKLRREVNESWQERQRALRDPNAPYDLVADLHEQAKAAAIRAGEEGAGV